MAAFTASQAKVENGSKVVQINSGESIANVRGGDFLVLAGFIIEINRAYLGADGKGYFELVKNWPNSSQSNQECIVIPTTGEFKKAVDALTSANALVNDNFKAMQAWQTQMGTVTFVNKDGTTTTVKTLKQIEADNLAQMSAYHPHPWAMRKVEFEAMRAANNEKYAASGFVYKGKVHTGTGYSKVADGLWTNELTPNVLRLGRGGGQGESKTDMAVLHIAGVITVLENLGTSGTLYGAEIKLPLAEDGTRTYDIATGLSVVHATPTLAFAAETATNKVVTDRADMWSFEDFLREINDDDPFVYKNGLIQSSATSINSVPTVDDNIRPVTYFAWYKGDTTSRGKGVNWQTATEAQRIAIASDRKNKIYFDDATGKFYQRCVRGLSFAGLGNGDWQYIDVQTTATLRFDLQSPVFGSVVGSYYVGATNGKYDLSKRGCYQEYVGTVLTGKLLLVCGTVNRLNQGGYHQSFNPLGTRSFFNRDGSQSAEQAWDHVSTKKVNSRAQCFDIAQSGNTAGDVSPFVYYGSGNISSSAQYRQRPDKKVFDAIDASGQGGVCRDMRYSAGGLTAEDFAKADLEIKSGTYRGREILKQTKVFDIDTSTGVANSGIITGHTYKANYWSNLGLELNVGENYYVLNQQTGELFYTNNDSKFINSGARDHVYFPTPWGGSPDIIVIRSLNLQTSIAAEYTHTEVIGDPAKILLCNDLQGGWIGSWNPVLPTTSPNDYDLTRPSLSVPVIKESTDLGSSWTETTTGTWDSLENAFVGKAMQSTDTIWLLTYKSKAKLTTDSIKGVVHGGDKGIGDVYVCSWGGIYNQGRDLGYSLISKVSVGANSYSRNMTYKLSQGGVDSSGQLPVSVNYPIKHPVVDITPVESPAFKTLNYNVVKNQQAFIHYAYTQLTYDATAGDWGDDSKIHIADNQTTMLDENGHSNLVGMACCVETIGWIKNDK